MSTPAIGSKWRSTASQESVTVDAVDTECCGSSARLRLDGSRWSYWATLTPSGRPCGYEEVKP